MTTLTCKIPRKLAAALAAVAEERKIAKSQIIREALVATLGKKKIRVSAYDLMKDSCGIIKRGATDLATGPRHLKGFGED